ncbi:Chromo' (CHRromatin Organization MOdifier) domain protein [Paragonimus heterotremus]|uniref:Chromo' (CHRromatin Organization MOdifier) domain protein n=1 Tax=Paragonimus heterotremus TaxID=100268 RepID=A0A8J4WHI1_9TREM|nr:Chromo' (CHRromatin Organization MOdifier) domain protein [Paragonimus heterotremus]
MASVGENFMNKQLRVCRRRPKRRMASKTEHSTSGPNNLKNVSQSTTLTTDSQHSDSMYLVEDIVGEKVIRGQKYYKVRWQGFPPESDSWEPEGNLTSVVDIIHSFHRKSGSSMELKTELSKDSSLVANSPASVPTPPCTPYCVASSNGKRLRGASEERQISNDMNSTVSRKLGTKSRTRGRYEYIPKHELVASKTKYFDDIRDGKIDLISNDLYSRVKTRRRANEAPVTTSCGDSQQSGTYSTHDDSDHEAEMSIDRLTTSTIKREPQSPSSDCFNTGESLSGVQSSVDSMESDQIKRTFTEQVDSLAESIPDSVTHSYSIPEMDLANSVPAMTCKTSNQETQCSFEDWWLSSGLHTTVSCGSSFLAQSNSVDVAVSPIASVCTSPRLDHRDDFVTSSLCTVNADTAQRDASTQSDNLGYSSPTGGHQSTVFSLRECVNAYFNLIASSNRPRPTDFSSGHEMFTSSDSSSADPCEVTTLSALPRLLAYSSSAKIRTRQDLLNALNGQRWSLLAALPAREVEPLQTRMTESSGFCTLSTQTTDFPSIALEDLLQRPCSPLFTPSDDPSQKLITNSDLLVASVVKASGGCMLLDRLLALGLDPNVRLDSSIANESLFMLAVRLRRVHIVQALLDAGARPDHMEPGPSGRTALGLALASGDVDMATVLILAGANLYRVESETTALSLILRLLNAPASVDPLTKLSSIPTSDLRDKIRVSDNLFPPIPSPSPPPGISLPTVPQSVLLNAAVNASTTTCQNNALPTTPSNSGPSKCAFTALSPPLNYLPPTVPPSVDSLRQLYDLVAAHHARLSVSVNSLVRNWLTRAGLVQVALVSPCQWINTRERSVTVSFTWPMSTHLIRPSDSSSSSRLIAPILLLVHGRVTPPACYDTWMDDEGPCLVERVWLDQTIEQKPLGLHPFATTLFPLHWSAHVGREHRIRVDFHTQVSSSVPARPICVAVMVIAVSPNKDEPTAPHVNRPLSFISQPHRSPHSHRGSLHSPPFTPRRPFS